MPHRTSAAVVGVLLTLALAAPAQGAPTIATYAGSMPGDASPEGLVAGPDGNLWVGESGSSGAVFKVTPAGVITKLETSIHPLGLVAGPDGNVWLTAAGGSKLGALNPFTGALSEHPFATSYNMEGITAAPGGALWVTTTAPKAAILRVVPSAAAELAHTEFALPTASGKPAQITVGAEGEVWFTEGNNPGAIGRVNPATGEVREFTKGLTINSRPTGITTGPEGDIWFTEAVSPGRIGRIIPATGEITEYSAGLTVGEPQRITAGSDGNLYFTESAVNGAIGQITPAGHITEYTEGLSSRPEPWGITPGPDGNIWFTLKANPARVGRLTLAPGVTAGAATNVTSDSATLTAAVRANAQATSYHFQYGTTTAYGAQTATASAGSAPTAALLAASVGGLGPATTYHFRVIAENASGTTYSADTTFTTAPPGVNPAPVPVIGRLAGVEPISGTVRIRNSHGALVPLTGPATLPLGTVMDTTHGVVKLITALPAHSRTQAVTVWGGVFKITQAPRGNGLTHIVLKTPLACGRQRSAHASGRSSAVRRRTLWSKDNHGLYSTYGSNTVATVRGTEWETIDSCAGTLTRVVHGQVSVRDLHRHRTILVRAGHSYLARP